MLFAGFSIAKLLGGLAFWQGEKLGKLIYMLVIIVACLGIFWKIFIAPTNTTTQHAQTIQNITSQQEKDLAFLGIKLWILKFGVSVEHPENKVSTKQVSS